MPPSPPAAPQELKDAAAVASPKLARKSSYIPWRELLRRTFVIDIKCTRCLEKVQD